jgi:hypothetical protein
MRNLFEKKKMKPRRPPKQDDFALESNRAAWPKDTWFQKRLRYVREHQQDEETGSDVGSERSPHHNKLR